MQILYQLSYQGSPYKDLGSHNKDIWLFNNPGREKSCFFADDEDFTET